MALGLLVPGHRLVAHADGLAEASVELSRDGTGGARADGVVVDANHREKLTDARRDEDLVGSIEGVASEVSLVGWHAEVARRSEDVRAGDAGQDARGLGRRGKTTRGHDEDIGGRTFHDAPAGVDDDGLLGAARVRVSHG